MGWVQVVLMVLSFLRSLKNAPSQEAFAASAKDVYGLDGKWVRVLWENREEILAFVLQMIELFKSKDEQEPFAAASGDPESAIADAIAELKE